MYGQRPVALGLQSNGNLLQVFASETTGTWALVTMHPSGVACLMGVGNSWEMLPQLDADIAAEPLGHRGPGAQPGAACAGAESTTRVVALWTGPL